MAIRLQCKAYTVENKVYDIIIHDLDYIGAIIDFTVDDDGYVLSYDSESEDLHDAGIITTKCEFLMLMDRPEHEAFVDDLNSATENQFVVEIKYGNLTKWFGRILPDLVDIEDLPVEQLPGFRVRAVDGVSKLKDVDYKFSSGTFVGRDTIVEHLLKCISFIGLETYAAEAWVLETVVNWFATNQGAGDPAKNITIDHRIFFEVDEAGKIKYRSVYDVLQVLCKSFHAKFMLHNGTYKFVQYNEGIATSVNVYRYDVNGNLFSNSSANINHAVNDTYTGKLGGGRFQFFAAVNEAVVNYIHFGYSNIAPGVVWSQLDQPTIPVPPTTFVVKEDDVVSFQANLKYTIRADGVNIKAIKFNILIKVGDDHVNRPVTIGYNGVPYRGVETVNTNTANRFVVAVPVVIQVKETNITIASEDVVAIEFATGQFENEGDLTFSIESATVWDENEQQITSGINDFLWKFTNVQLNVISEGDPSKYQNTRTTRIENTNLGNSLKKTLNIPVGQEIGFGRLYVATAGAPEAGIDWGVGSGAAGVTFEELLAREYIKTRLIPVKKSLTTVERYNPSYTSDYDIHKTIVHKGDKWIFWKGKYIAHKELYDGIWYRAEVGTSTGTATEEPGVIRDYPGDATVFTPIPIGDGENPGIGKEKNFDKEPGLVEIIFPQTNGEILGGATVTEISIPTRTKDGEFREGQEIILTNPFTGLQEAFTVSSDTATGDTTVKVDTKTSNGYFPPGSVIVTTQTEQTTSIVQAAKNEKWFDGISVGDSHSPVVLQHDLKTERVTIGLINSANGSRGWCDIDGKTLNTITISGTGEDNTYDVKVQA